MSLKAAFEQVQDASAQSTGCKVHHIFEGLDEADRVELDAALHSDMNSAMIAAALQSVDIKVPANTLRRHRRRECGCVKWAH
jgi:folate-dependent phosphoribosylglycinamide formyltransferase PurN